MRTWRVLASLGVLVLGGFWIREACMFKKDYWPNGQLKSKAPKSLLAIEIIGGGPCGAAPGITKGWHEDGSLAYVINTDECNRMVGEQLWYGRDGKVLDRWTYDAKGRPLAGRRVSRWENGKVHQDVTYDSEGRWDGRVLRMNDQGEVLLDWVYAHGAPADGLRIIKRDSGELCSEALFEQGVQRAGVLYFENACKAAEFRFEKNQLLDNAYYDDRCGHSKHSHIYKDGEQKPNYEAIVESFNRNSCE